MRGLMNIVLPNEGNEDDESFLKQSLKEFKNNNEKYKNLKI